MGRIQQVYFSNISIVIHAFLLLKYWNPQALGLLPLKHRGFTDLPMKQSGNFSLPSALHATPRVIRNLSVFFPLICFVIKPLSGGALFKIFLIMTFKKIDKTL